MKQLIAADFDGTFCVNGQVPPVNHTAIRAWRAAGRLFGIVTGRGSDFFAFSKQFGIQADFFLLHNGATLALPDGRVVKTYRIERPDFVRLQTYFTALPDVLSCSRAGEATSYPQYYAVLPTVERALAAAQEVNRQLGDRVNAVVNGQSVNVGPKGSGKAQGVRDALAYFGLPADGAAVFGDNFNDMEMILAHNGWAVAGGQPALVARAPHVCQTVGEAALALLAGDESFGAAGQ